LKPKRPPDVSEERECVREGEPDEALVARCRGGDAAAFETLVGRHQGRLFRLAFHMLRDREGALDAVQETFIRAYRSLHRFSGEGSFGGWLLRIAANLAVDGIRRRRRGERVEVPTDDGDLAELPAPHRTPVESAEGGELRGRLERALAKLSPMQRVVLVMKEIEGFSCEEIAVTLRCSVGTVMSRLHYSRLKMKRMLRRPRGTA
jgi:RNA polymerase sigma-70 factor (ECF subfamily)